jgi:2-polyprenyl-3-methyl-5-hydroxy-6-metoxy-1,4-benzoquinol methylase
MKPQAYSLMKELEHSYWWYRARREIICDAVARHLSPGAAVVDFGSGTGATSIKLRDAGFAVTAADVSEHALSACRAAGLPSIDLRQQWIPDASADCVLACDVLEHVEEDVELLIKLRRALRPGGRLIVTVPAYEFLWSGEDYVSEHFRRYTQKTLLQAIKSAQYAPIWCSYFNTFLSPMVVGTILTKRLFRPRDMYRSNVERLPHWLNELLYSVFALERSALENITFPVGTSILLVARCAGAD